MGGNFDKSLLINVMSDLTNSWSPFFDKRGKKARSTIKVVHMTLAPFLTSYDGFETDPFLSHYSLIVTLYFERSEIDFATAFGLKMYVCRHQV